MISDTSSAELIRIMVMFLLSVTTQGFPENGEKCYMVRIWEVFWDNPALMLEKGACVNGDIDFS